MKTLSVQARLIWLLMLASAPLCTGESLAQTAPGGLAPGALPVLRRPDGKPAGLTPEIESFLKQFIQTYAKAQSYRDHGHIKLVQLAGRVKTTTEMPMELAFQRPNCLRLDAGQYVAASDGKQLYFVVPGLGQFTEGAAPEKLERKHLIAGSILGGADEGHPELIDFLTKEDAFDQLTGQIAKIGWKPDATVEGVKCRVLAYETAAGTKVVNFIDAKRFVLLRVEAETSPEATTSARPPAASAPNAGATSLLYEVSRVELNPQMDPATFAYQPPGGLRRVSQIGANPDSPDALPGTTAPKREDQTVPIIGAAAPPIQARDLNNQPFDGAAVQGKVALLFFWSLAGGEHSLSSIPVVQEVSERFKGRPELMVLGINLDPEARETVAQLMERKKASFRTLMDEGMKLARAFELGGVPSFVVVGTDGTVKWAKLGAGPALKDELIREVEKALPAAKK